MSIKSWVPTDPKVIVKTLIIVVVATALGVVAMGTDAVKRITKR